METEKPMREMPRISKEEFLARFPNARKAIEANEAKGRGESKPRYLDEGKLHQIQIKVAFDIYRKLQAEAKRQARTMASMLRFILEDRYGA